MLFRPSVDEVIYIHEEEVCRPAVIRDRYLLEAAVERPWQSAGLQDAWPTIHLKAAALYEALSNHQPFKDGNKRTALLAVRLFYAYAGFVFAIPLSEGYELHEYISTTRPVDYDVVAGSLGRWAQPIPKYPEEDF